MNHGVSSVDPLYNGLLAPGVDVTVARGTQGQVIIEESGGFTDIRESATFATDSYTVRLAQAPCPGCKVYVTVSAAMSPQTEQANGDTFLVSNIAASTTSFERTVVLEGVDTPVKKRAIVLVFDGTNWMTPQTVNVYAVQDTRAEGDRVVVSSHSVISADPAFNGAVVRNVEVTVHDDDLPAIQIVALDGANAQDNSTLVVEGTATTGLTDRFLLRLATQPTSAVLLQLTLSDLRIGLSAPGLTSLGGGVYQISIPAANWQSGVVVTVTAVDDATRQDPHDTTIAIAVVDASTPDTGYKAAADARLDARVIDDDTAGVVVVETGGRTLVTACGNPACTVPGAGDGYGLRLTKQPTAPVTVALLTDGQTDVTLGGRIALAPIGGLTALQQFSGDISIAGAVVTRTGAAALGNFLDEGFAAGQRIRIANAGAANGDYVVAGVAMDGKSMTLTTPGPAGTFAGALISRLIERGVYTGSIAWNPVARTLTRTDGSSWLDSGFLEGQLFKVDAFGATLFKVQAISGTAAGKLDVLRIVPDAALPAAGTGPVTVTQWAATVTFDATNWYQPVTVPLVADTDWVVQPGRENVKTFPKRLHLLSDIRGPLAVEGGTTAVDRSLRPAVLLPGEANAPFFGIAPQPPESQQVDVLNVFADSSREDLVGTITATALTGLNMGGQLNFTLPAGSTMPFGEPTSFPGGISYGRITIGTDGKILTDASTSTIEVLNVLLGEGNDRLTITSTLVAGPDRNADGTPGPIAVHGGITTVHGGGNSRLASGAIGGDTILISGGGGPDSPLVVYGDTSQDGLWYSGDPRTQSIRDFGTKPFPSEIGNGSPRFFFPVAGSYAYAGHDVIDASAHPGGPAGALWTVGIVAYGGAGDDLIIGTQTGDHLAGGSGDDTILGQRGADVIYGDNGVNVDVISRELFIPYVNASVRPVRDDLRPGNDTLFGEGAGSLAARSATSTTSCSATSASSRRTSATRSSASPPARRAATSGLRARRSGSRPRAGSTSSSRRGSPTAASTRSAATAATTSCSAARRATRSTAGSTRTSSSATTAGSRGTSARRRSTARSRISARATPTRSGRSSSSSRSCRSASTAAPTRSWPASTAT